MIADFVLIYDMENNHDKFKKEFCEKYCDDYQKECLDELPNTTIIFSSHSDGFFNETLIGQSLQDTGKYLLDEWEKEGYTFTHFLLIGADYDDKHHDYYGYLQTFHNSQGR